MSRTRKRIRGSTGVAILAITGILFTFSPFGCGGNDNDCGSPHNDNDDGNPQVLSATILEGQVTFYNHCDHELLIKPDHGIDSFILPANTGSNNFPLVTVGANNRFYAAVLTTDEECNNLNYCKDWATTLYPPPPPPLCYDTAKWTGGNLAAATYCDAARASHGWCNDASSNCCGNHIEEDMVFGSLFEINITFTSKGQDFPDISTNSNCTCSSSPTDDQCLTGSPIFFNAPLKWSTNQDCYADFATTPTISESKCYKVDCPEAYTHPEDAKQVACPKTGLLVRNPNRGYLVEYCPDGHILPSIPPIP